ncbi:MAG: TSUP family transporter [Pseudomonadota bacterium]
MNSLLLDFNAHQLVLTGLLFVWTGFVRSGLGFGGAALGLPFMLFIYDQPLFWLPVIGAHLLFFSALTLRTRLNNVDWEYLRRAAVFIVPAAVVGVFGLINLPNHILVIFIYAVTLIYAVLWMLDLSINSRSGWTDKLLLTLGGYVAGTSLTGAPLMVAVFMRNVAIEQLRNTLFVLWFVLVSIKMTTFVTLGVPLHWQSALLLLPAAAIGHVLGLKAHDAILKNDRLFKRVIGGLLVVVSGLGLWDVLGG